MKHRIIYSTEPKKVPKKKNKDDDYRFKDNSHILSLNEGDDASEALKEFLEVEEGLIFGG